MRLRVLLGISIALLGLSVPEATAAADPTVGPAICASAGTALSGSHRNLIVTGNTYVASGTTLVVNGNLILVRGSCLDAFTLGTVHVGGNVLVGKGAIFALGCTPGSIGPAPPCNTETTNDTVGGNIVADQPYTMYLDGDTVRGNVVSIGGGPGPTLNPYVNFPIKDNTILGNLVVQGWKGAWFGVLRDTVRGNVILADNVGVTIGDLGTPDSTEVATNTISGNLICLGNVPAAQVGDSEGSPNTVGGHKIGQCADL